MAGLPPHSQTDEPFPIFEDDFFTQPAPMISNAPMPSQPTPARPPLQNQSPNALLCPPTTTAAPLKQSSPFKSNALPQSSPLGTLNNASQKSRLNMVPMVPPAMAPPAAAPQSTDSLEKKQPVMSRFKTVAKKPQPDTGMQFLPKETLAQLPAYPAPAQSQFDLDLGNFYRNDSGKRVLMEAAPIKELRPSKKQRTEDPLPAHDSFPPIADDGQKPNHSYATLIAMAIVRSPHRRLTLSQIYKWISDTYSYYRGDSTGWQNSIRHNLSLNKSFVKQERPKDDPGKGSYWSIEPGTEHTVLKEKPSRKAAAPTAENMPVMSTRLEPSQPQPQQPQPQQQQLLQQQPLQQPPLQQPPQQQQPQLQPSQLPCIPDHMVSAHLAMPQSVLPALPPSSSQQPQQNLAPAPPLMSMISSDATIPASDAATIEDLEPQMYSPLPAAMHSSPPIPRRMESIHNGTPPPSYRQMLHLSSATQSRPRRRFMSMDDSGYISSLESSAMRPHQNSKLLTSEADRPRIKKGRAEEEIARIRGSSYDSPSKGRSYGYPPPSSSPLRQSDSGSGQMLPPLTPASKFQAPPKPPPSVSPSTNLRLHRENIQSMVDSPFRRVSALMPEGGDSLQQQTPRMNSESLWYFFDDQGLPGSNSNTPGFDIHEDAVDFHAMFSTTPTTATNVTHLGSPAKRPSSRKQRAQSTNALGLVPESATNNAQRQSFLRVPNQNNSLGLDTPSKAFEGLPSSPSKAFEGLPPSPTKMPNTNDENLFQEVSLDGLAGGSFDDGDFAGLDMLAGFQRIGGGGQQQQQQQQLGGQGSYGRSPNGGPF
ncbi:hypothetical protein C8A05DRAFT_12388 [Staphylotrichum tortipilum]|uniref:Fork-head domain-containing protein n=1 Tax=Staphylotrichum tortipilum TaxID=2831512 RepID=A0AAN6RWZ0_9PEZI|nr:hypothetical protein C8A05DRAFT_12388 [Staphylotrichum longicolle]